MSAPNVLILDEPTNDLDVQTLGVLEEYLEEFNGCVIVVSHDRYFLDRTVNTIFALEDGGNIKQYPGNYSVYVDYKKAAEEEEKELQSTEVSKQQKQSQPVKNVKYNQSQKLSFKEKYEYKDLEEKIPLMEAEKEELEKTLYSDPPNDFTKMQSLTERLSQLIEDIDTATERWLELADRDS
jgi:ATP-binding cassette subfamily F protein uup